MMFLESARQEAGHIFKSDDRDIERVTEAYEARRFFARVNIQNASQHRGLICNDPNGMPAESRKTNYDVLRVILMDFIEMAVVHDHADDFFYIVRFICIIRDNII